MSVLFADISGFTSLSERLDPEDVHALMNQAFELMLDEIHRYEGSVNQFLGDGIMALFGAPIAHEDHAQRAAHAALGIQQRLDDLRYDRERRRGIAFQVRQGLNTGLVARGLLGLGALARRTGRRQDAAEDLATATGMFRDMGMPLWLAQAEAETSAL